ncbi:TonB-dependent receptor [Pedobacter sp. SD-b]|uniref:TonB-dependent receptor n=1 Tax=Pedobacter segetis TaxID=2793069 RepID=A0ABS1BFG5_9SPHI|nr:carboxypeptidase regulatory-like domain-containing protein [Pedobacter segetis]MBK0381603.1 TonB-dependent receptor [Pedobacter segetis]
MKRKLQRKLLMFFALISFTALSAVGQVTTSSMSGIVKDSNGETMPGASIKAIHTPTGSVYTTQTTSSGRFTIPNMNTGGPYTIEFTFIGFNPKKFDGIFLKLGSTYNLDVVMEAGGKTLNEVVVTAPDKNSILNSTRIGAATNISSKQLTTLPTINRSITDFVRTTPQASGNGFAGRDGRYNNLQVDGANLNNNFGLSSDPLPGGGAQPISIDAYQEISVNIAPYDVRQSGFTGAGINAITKSGTNKFSGTAYTFYRNQNYLGTNVGSTDISSQIQDTKSNIYGFSLGGPIIKNKLFFFINAESEKNVNPGISYTPTGGSGSGNVSTTTAADLKKVSDYVKQKFGYNTGAYDNFPNFETKNTKILAKLDWNINKINKLTLKYSDLDGTDDQSLNGSSVPNGGGFNVTGKSNITRLPYNRFSNNSMSYNNSNYFFNNRVRTGTLELKSNINSQFSNQFLTTYTKIGTSRDVNSSFFPTVDVFDGAGGNLLTFGTDPFTANNNVKNNIISFTDNLTYYKGIHTFTGGLTYEQQYVGNQFMPAAKGYYAFNSVDDVLNNAAPAYFAYTYSLKPGDPAPYAAEIKVGQLGIYAQDDIDFDNGLKLTVGLRGDKPIYLDDQIENTAITALQFYDKKGNLKNYKNSDRPSNNFLLSPRLGFRYDVKKDNSLILRGGTGIFTGRIPFVWLTNAPSNSGVIQFGGRLRNSNATEAVSLAGIRLTEDPTVYANLFPTNLTPTAPGNIVLIDPNFKFPSVFRTNLAVDKKIGNGYSFTLEGLFTKDINGVVMRNANNKAPNGAIVDGPNASRLRYTSTANRDLNSSITSAIVLENTNKGYSGAITALLSKDFSSNFYGSIAYTYTSSKDVTANPGSQAASVWNGNPVVGTLNNQELYNSSYLTPHRVVMNASYNFKYAKYFGTTVSLFYEGASQGNYSFVINGDANLDGGSSTDLMYIPNKTSDVVFEQYTATVNNAPVTFTVQQQQDAFEKFIESSPYLSKNRGKYAERNGAQLPWYNEIDFRLLQDFMIKQKSINHNLQLSVDIFNLPNLLNKNWGIKDRYVTNNPLGFRSINANNQPVYRLQNNNGNLVTNYIQDNISTASTWRMQIGLRYKF